jgi:hypothetical protein
MQVHRLTAQRQRGGNWWRLIAPDLIIGTEPTSSLAETERQRLFEIIASKNSATGLHHHRLEEVLRCRLGPSCARQIIARFHPAGHRQI